MITVTMTQWRSQTNHVGGTNCVFEGQVGLDPWQNLRLQKLKRSPSKGPGDLLFKLSRTKFLEGT